MIATEEELSFEQGARETQNKESTFQTNTISLNREILRIVAINIGSNRKNIQRVVDKYNKYDLILISEAGTNNSNVWLENTEEFNQWIKPNSKKKAKDSMIMLINKDWEYEPINTSIPRSKSIRIRASVDRPIDLHFVYGPPDQVERKPYWKKWKKYLTEQEEGERNNIIIGDLNNILDPEKDRLNNTKGNSNSLLKLVHEGGLVDAVQAKSPEHKFSWFRFSKGEKKLIEASRIDHALVDETWMEYVDQAYIEDFDTNLSPDHSAVVLEIQIPKPKKIPNRSPRLEQKIETIKIGKLKFRAEEYQNRVKQCIEKRRREDHNLEPAEKWNKLAVELKSIATALCGTEKRTINGKRMKKVNYKVLSLRKKLRRISKALGSSLRLKKGDPPTRKIRALEANGEKYSLPPPQDGDWTTWREKLNEMKNQLSKELQTEENAEENKRIKELIEKL